VVGFVVLRLDELEWETRPGEPGDPERQRAALTERAEFLDSAV
jgi:hypothetical protein